MSDKPQAATDPNESLGSQPIQPEYRAQMQAIADVLDETFNGDERPKKVGFVMMCFPFGDDFNGRCNYISNARREDVITLLREQLSYFEGMPETPAGVPQ